VLLSSVIRAHLQDLFPGREVGQFSQFRVTRHSDLAVDEDDVPTCAPRCASGLQHAPLRPGGAPGGVGRLLRAAVGASCCKQFDLPEAALYRCTAR
jgi:polyphosphate kinase